MEVLFLIVLFALSVIGMTNIVVNSSLFKPIREFFKDWTYIYDLLTCSTCSGFWVGLLCGYILFNLSWATIFLLGCAGSFLATVGDLWLDKLEGSIVHYFDDEADDEKLDEDNEAMT